MINVPVEVDTIVRNIIKQLVVIEEVSENIHIEETLIAQQQTLLFDEDNLLCIVLAKNKSPISLLFQQLAI